VTETFDPFGSPDSADEWSPHLDELRRRVLLVLAVFLAATAAAFCFSSRLAAFLTEPVEAFRVRLYTFAPAEKFMSHLHLAVWTGALFAVPFLSVQAAFFLWPGLRKKERCCAASALFAVPVLFILGAALCYRFLAPAVFGFFLSFGASDGIGTLWSLREYLALLFDLMLASGFLLQAPLLLLALLLTGVVSPEAVARRRSPIVLTIFFLSALLTPPDVVSQVLLGLPLFFLFEGALALGRVLKKR
jgi:sec-independent protein translocase protein TatC